MKVRLTSGRCHGAIARLEALLAGMILTVSTAYAATICPLYWTQLQLEEDLCYRLVISQAVQEWREEHGRWPQPDLAELAADGGCFQGGVPTSPLTGRPYRLDPATHRVE